MLNIQALAQELTRVRDEVNQIEVRGRENAGHLVIAYEVCNDLIRQLDKIYEESKRTAEEENTEETGDDAT